MTVEAFTLQGLPRTRSRRAARAEAPRWPVEGLDGPGRRCVAWQTVDTKRGQARRCAEFAGDGSMAKKRKSRKGSKKVCTNKAGKRVSCKRQRAGKKAARTRKRGKGR